MLDHLLLNKLKWFNIGDNTNSVNANGKDWEAIPKQITLSRGVKIATFSGDGSAFTTDAIIMLNSDATANVIGKIANCYAITGIFNGTGQDTGTNATLNLEFDERFVYDSHRYEVNFVSFGLVPESEAKNVIWGGKNLLFAAMSMVERAFTSFKKGAKVC